MHELIGDLFYEVQNEYDRLMVDYCLVENDAAYHGYSSHKEVLLFAMNKLRDEYPWITITEEMACAEEVSAEELFAFPDKPWKENAHGTVVKHINFSDGGKIPYWYAFLEPPHGTGSVIKNGKTIREEYSREDFELVNRALFPKGIEELEIYDWTTDWSDYFEAGKEWWGTMCYSIYDKKMNRFVVLMASATD